MDIGRQLAGVIKQSNTHEPNQLADATKQDQIVAPDSYLAVRTARNSLVGPTWRRDFNVYDITMEKVHPVRFDQSVYRESGSALALAPTAVTAVDNEGSRLHSEAHVAAGTAAFVNVSLT